MGLLTFRCPHSGQAIDAGIETDTDTLSQLRLFRLRLACPICGAPHDYRIQDAIIVDKAIAARAA